MVKPDGLLLNASTDASDAAWFNIKKVPQLAFDHQEIVAAALKRLQSKIVYEPLGFELLEEKFPFSEFEKLYMAYSRRGDLLNTIADDACIQGTRPGYVQYEGKWYVATADYGIHGNEVRLYDPVEHSIR